MSEIQNFELFKYYLGKEGINSGINSYDSNYLRKVRDEFKKFKRELIMQNHKIERIMHNKYHYKGFNSDISLYDVNHGYKQSYNIDVLKDPTDAVTSSLAHLNESYCKTKITSNNMEICFVNQNIKEIERVLRSRRSIT